jgi:hypothetical protein
MCFILIDKARLAAKRVVAIHSLISIISYFLWFSFSEPEGSLESIQPSSVLTVKEIGPMAGSD